MPVSKLSSHWKLIWLPGMHVDKCTNSYTSTFKGIKQLFVGVFSRSNFPLIPFSFYTLWYNIRHIAVHQDLEWLLAMDNTSLLAPVWGCQRCLKGGASELLTCTRCLLWTWCWWLWVSFSGLRDPTLAAQHLSSNENFAVCLGKHRVIPSSGNTLCLIPQRPEEEKTEV